MSSEHPVKQDSGLSDSTVRRVLERIRERTRGASYGMGAAIAAMCDEALTVQSPSASDEALTNMTLSDAQIETFMAEARAAISRGRLLDSQVIASWALWTLCQEAKRFRALQDNEIVSSGGPLAKRTSVMSEAHKSGYRLVIGFERRSDLDAAHKYVTAVGHGPKAGADDRGACPRCGSELRPGKALEPPSMVPDAMRFAAIEWPPGQEPNENASGRLIDVMKCGSCGYSKIP